MLGVMVQLSKMLVLALALSIVVGCSDDDSSNDDGGPDTDTDTDTDADELVRHRDRLRRADHHLPEGGRRGCDSGWRGFQLGTVRGHPAAHPFSSSGTGGYGIVVDDAGTRLFVANCNSNSVSVLDVASDDTLTAVTGSPFAAADSSCVDTPQLMNDETVLSITDEGGHLFAYLVDGGTFSGSLRPLSSIGFQGL